MSRFIFSQYSTCNLLEVGNKLDADYYGPLDTLCTQVCDYAYKLKENDTLRNTEIYTNLCTKLAQEIKFIISSRRKTIIPYLSSLMEKSDTGHNCANCSGNCALNHSIHLTELEDSQQHLRELLYRLNKVALPLYSDPEGSELYKTLRNEMHILDTTLSELFFLEESVLIPKVIEAQKAMNVYH